jgi:hypothetical protein
MSAGSIAAEPETLLQATFVTTDASHEVALDAERIEVSEQHGAQVEGIKEDAYAVLDLEDFSKEIEAVRYDLARTGEPEQAKRRICGVF